MMKLLLPALTFTVENVLKVGLPTMLVGMVGIFLVIAFIILVVWALGKITNDANFSKGLKRFFGGK